MNCTNCGAANEPDARFCAECGAPLKGPAGEDDIIIVEPPPEDADRTILSSRAELEVEEATPVNETEETFVAEVEEFPRAPEVPPAYEAGYSSRPEPADYEAGYGREPEFEPGPPPPPESLTGGGGGPGFWTQRNIIIVAVVIILLLCCCCAALAIGGALGSGILDELNYTELDRSQPALSQFFV
jgi:hypothetical protein